MIWSDFIVLFLSIVFGYSGIVKIFSISSFNETITQLGFSLRSSRPIAIAICIAECLSAILLLFDATQVYGQIIMILLSLGFLWSVYHANVVKKTKIRCNCFGTSSHEYLGLITVVKNVMFILLNASMFLSAASTRLFSGKLEETILNILIIFGILVLYLLISSYITLHKMIIRRTE
ncbi:MauE/DoxX family redox-associated membrane protein [Paenibacillus aquistagni]|uniref:Methylamine utilisation protein MauE domain-containing protein n=1 Tax=Paenibacillus aquistagni TaxID=1852522 RepID=A0A1X7LQ55_9BACL|nr:MauE/DoxX family redox-associated membrane protein [Paenibacillus aquistagni]NMM53385.1 hypothetical protein [Paenibacillus aquistagni]SMG55382.1 hypothetical protein SAMN06295960_3894 [Paenibacillus aquistagni]